MSTFEFKELEVAADNVRFNDKTKLPEFMKAIAKLQKAISDSDMKRYKEAIKNIRKFIQNKTHGRHFKEFDDKLKELETKCAKGAGFSCVIFETKTDESGAVGGRKQSNESNSMECGPEKSDAGRRLQSSDSSTSAARQRRTESKRIKTETSRGPSSVKEVTDNDECQIEIEKLNEKLENACKDYSIKDNTDTKSSNVGTKEKRSPIKQQFDRVNEQVDRIIEGLEMTRGMSNVKGKVQNKHVQNATESVEREAKARMDTVIMWLKNVQKQIHSDKIDVLIFQLPKEDWEEVKTIKACLEDICVKVKSISDKRVADENKNYAEEQRKQDEMIKKIWSEVSDTKSETKNTMSCLNDLEKKVKEMKKEITKVADEKKRYAEEQIKQDEMIKKIWSEVSDKKSKKKNTISCLDDLEEIVKEMKKELTKLVDENKRYAEELRKQDEMVKKLLSEVSDIKTETKNTMSCLNDLESIVKEGKKESAKLAHENKRYAEEQQKQDEMIKKIWSEVSDKNSETKNTMSCLNDLEKIVKERREKKEITKKPDSSDAKLQQQVNELWKLVFGSEDNTKDNKCDERSIMTMLESITTAIKKTEVKNKGMSKLKQRVITLYHLITGRSETEQYPDNDGHDIISSIEEMLNEIIPQFQKLEKLSFELEGMSHEIFTKLFSTQPHKKDEMELQSCVTVLQQTSELLKRCSAETNLLDTEFSRFTIVMELEKDNAAISEQCKSIKETVQGWRTESKCMKKILDKASELLPEAYSALTADPYFFTQPDVDFKKIKDNFPEWMHSAAMFIKQIHCCVQSNRESFNERFIETRPVLTFLFQMYKDETKRDYEDPWEGKSMEEQRVSGKSSKSHVMLVTEDICKQMCKRSEDFAKQRCQADINKLQYKCHVLEEEKGSLLTRLSKFASANLTDKNPNIADLSDSNRPTKLAEEYSELYDNEWTNAYEALEKTNKTEKEIHSMLYDIITVMFNVCADVSSKQDYILRTVLLSPTRLSNSKADAAPSPTGKKTKVAGSAKAKQSSKKDTDEVETLSAVHSQTISELRKQTAQSSLEDITTFLKTQENYSHWFRTKPLEDYTLRCIKLCWLMNVQNPPVYVDQEDIKGGKSFDTTKFKPYTKAGKKIAFVVWPVLYLHKDGPLLAKGVAQGK